MHEKEIPLLERKVFEFFCLSLYIDQHFELHKEFLLASSYNLNLANFIFLLLFLCCYYKRLTYTNACTHTYTHTYKPTSINRSFDSRKLKTPSKTQLR